MFLYPNENLPSFSSFLRSVFFCPNALLFYLLLDHCLIRLSTVFLAFTSPPDSSDRPSLFLRSLRRLTFPLQSRTLTLLPLHHHHSVLTFVPSPLFFLDSITHYYPYPLAFYFHFSDHDYVRTNCSIPLGRHPLCIP